MYQALYRVYRPEVFEDVLGQEHIVKILKNQIATDSTSHAYLFCGTRGTGKTTTARLLAKGLNCLSGADKPCGKCANCQAIKKGNFIDVVEIDAASNNSVENIRELRESVNYPPAVGRRKVYIIDEVHMLSIGAFNALLKTLEEPPEYVTFILATTEVQKLPPTILSRCMRLDFKRIPENILIKGMAGICKKIDINVSEDALRIIAANADGSVRDGLSILDQCISGGEKTVSEKDVLDFLGASSFEELLELTEMVRKKKTSEAIVFVADVLSDGKDVRQFMRDWTGHYRNLLILKFMKNPGSLVNMSEENIERMRRQADVLELEDINRGILELSRTLDEARWSTQPRILLELAIVKLSLGIGKIMEINESELDFGVDEGEADVSNKKVKTNSDELDCQEIWNSVFEDGEAEKGSFFLIGNGSNLTSIGENSFTVEVGNDVTKAHVENNRKIIEDLMEKHTGNRRTMKISKKNLKKNSKSAEEIAEDVSEILGIKVEVE